MYSLTKTFDLFGFLFGCPPGKILDEDIHETDESWLVSIDMPGMRTAVRLDGNMLFLEGDRDLRNRKDSIRRAFALPAQADKEKISAIHENGVLTVTVPKRMKPPSKAIEVEVR